MFTLKEAKTPVYGNYEETIVNIEVLFEEFNGQWLPFTATSTDPESYGVDIYNRAKAGEFGAIAPYSAPPATQPQPQTQGSQTL